MESGRTSTALLENAYPAPEGTGTGSMNNRDAMGHMGFVATEAGFAGGVGGASNAEDSADYHYVLFGRQTDSQNPECSGVYFEFDGQIQGGVNRVGAITVADGWVSFELR